MPAHCGGESPAYAPNDLSWYANIPVPTSYMCVGTEEDFVGGYDFFKEAGLLHVADHHIAPGKKQWTWGNQEFGYAWDRNLTDGDGPYIEIMAGVYTDNQPDFSYIAPGETRTFSQFLYPYRGIGPAAFANIDVAISAHSDGFGVAATRLIEATVEAIGADGETEQWRVQVAPDRPFLCAYPDPVAVRVSEDGREIGLYERPETAPKPMKPATEPALPAEVESADELYTIGQHLEQYRHATRSPADYWQEALRRDPNDERCNNALGLWRLKRGEFEAAKQLFERAIERATSRNPNPRDGEPFYNLGIACRFLGLDKEAIDAFAKAAWNAAWQPAAYHALGELACRKEDWRKALEYLDRAVRKDQDNLRARNLRAIVLGKLGRATNLAENLELDPLDHWARYLSAESIEVDNGVRIDIAIDLMRAGFYSEALELLNGADRNAGDGTVPMLYYYEAFLLEQLGRDATEAYRRASAANPDYCFPARLEDIAVLLAAPPHDPRACYYLGNLYYDRRRYPEAIERWSRAIRLEPTNSICLRNLGIAAFNFEHEPDKSQRYYAAAIAACPADGRLLYEQDQLWKRIGIPPETRLTALRDHLELVEGRDDLTIEYCGLLNAAGIAEAAAEILEKRQFQPWEGGESMALGIFTQTQLILGRCALDSGDPAAAKRRLEKAVYPPINLGEARHLLANAPDLWLAYGDALDRLGEDGKARRWWTKAAEFRGDFQEMAVQPFSELTYYQALALDRLGRREEAVQLLSGLREYAERLARTPAKIDYFATSLPTMLLFEDDLHARNTERADRFLSQAAAGLEELG